MSQDVIDLLVGEALPLRNRRPITKQQSQLSFEALFETKQPGNFPIQERFAVATFIAALHQDQAAQNFYGNKLRIIDATLVTIIEQVAASALTQGPYGAYPAGPLSHENSEGLLWHADAAVKEKLGIKLTSALEHAHFLIFHPRDANQNHLNALLKADWQVAEIVTLSQLTAFLSYQLRVAHGLRILNKVSACENPKG